jgi:ubiquinone/menaquinone biosynthesis C-methylase UbiE
MPSTIEELSALLARPDMPRTAKYDPHWVIENNMGPHPLWLTEWLAKAMDLRPGMRILDLGCGRGLSSIFFAKEFGLQVWATDLWIGASENWQRIQQAGVEDTVFPLHCDARNLPYAHGFFDALVCVDAYIYFGTDDLYLDYFRQFVRPGGQIGMVVPGFMQEQNGPLPQHLIPFWAQECWTWHTVDWWRNLWERTGLVDIETADIFPDGWAAWLQWEKARWASGDHSDSLKSDIEVLERDQGQYMGWVRMVARSKA